ncbi:TcmI family type II polyketide cyclase, partial [Xanthomonas citri pv. citri]
PSHSVAKEFYSYVPEDFASDDTELTVLIQRMKPGSEENIAQVFRDSDAGPLPRELGVVGRWLYSIDDVFVHLLEQDKQTAIASRNNHDHRPAFGAIMRALAPYVSPYNPEHWQSHLDAQARVFYRWEAPDWGTPPPEQVEEPERAGSWTSA